MPDYSGNCVTWSLTADKRITGLCSMELLQDTSRKMKNNCRVCAKPLEKAGSCISCLVAPPPTYNVTLTIIPLKVIQYYRWRPEYADMGLVEDPPGWTMALVNSGESYNPSNCGYSRSYNLKQTDYCVWQSEERETVTTAKPLTTGSFNTSPTYEITCKDTIPSHSGYRYRVKMEIGLEGGKLTYHVQFRYITEYLGVAMYPVEIWERGYKATSPDTDRDCRKPFNFSQTGDPPFHRSEDPTPYPGAILWAFSVLPGPR